MLENIVALLEEKKADELKIYDVHSAVADYLIVATATSSVHAKSITGSLSKFFKEGGIIPRIEGETDSGWIVIDTGDFVIHLFTEKVRNHYKLDDLINETISHRGGGDAHNS